MKSAVSHGKFGVFLLGAVLFAGCGGGGGSSSAQSFGGSLVPSSPSTSQPTQIYQGPVAYMRNSGPLTSDGTIAQGSQQSMVAVMSGDLGVNGSFAQDTLTVSAPASGTSSLRTARSVFRGGAPARVRPVEAFPADDGALLARLRGIARGAASGTRAQGGHLESIPQQPSIGSTAPIWVERVGSSRSVQVPATMVAQTAHGNIWLDDTLLNTDADAAVPQIAADFENAYASDTAHFASPDYPDDAPGLQAQFDSCDANGNSLGSGSGYITEPPDHRIDVMIVNPNDLGGYGGYFSGVNLMQQSALNCLNGSGSSYQSNEAPFIFVGWFEGQGATYEAQEDLVRGTAHELQHLINFVNHVLLPAGASNTNFDSGESTFLNEGLSMLAQDFAVQRMYGTKGVDFDVDDAMARAAAYLANPGNFSIGAFDGIDGADWGGGGSPQYNCFGGCYGGAYLFQRYLADRFSGASYTHAIETSGLVGQANLAAVTGEPAGDLLDDFALAMAADTMGIASSDRRFTFGSLGLTNTYVDQFGGSRTLDGVYAQAASGGAATVVAPVGGFAFVSGGGAGSSGTPVTVTDKGSVSGFGLAGGLAQH